MARVKVEIARGNKTRVVAREDQNRFEPVLYSNLCIPSYVHGYSIAIEYMKQWFIAKMPINYFKYVHVNGKHMFDDYRRWNNQNIKREKPYLVITPNVETDHDRDTLDLYNAGASIFLKRSDCQRSFFRDTDKSYYLGMQLQELKMVFNFRVKVSTKAEQLDLFKRMELLYRIGGTQSEDISADFPLPNDVILNLASANGYSIKNGKLEDPIAFLGYLNKHSDIPITYKLRTINGKFEYFMRLTRLYAHIATLTKIQLDDGEREGQLDNNFAIDMEAVLKLPIPHFFVFYNEKPLEYSINVDDSASVDMYTLPHFVIPETDGNGWKQIINTSYELDLGEKSIDFTPLIKNTNMEKVKKHCLSNFISPACFLSMKFYRLDVTSDTYVEMNITIDYKTNTAILNDKDLIDEIIFIAIYGDKSYMNDTITTIDKLNESRISSNSVPTKNLSVTIDEMPRGRGTVEVD